MTIYTTTVDPNGGADYSSLSGWVSGEQGLYTAADTAKADCLRTGATKDTTQCTLSGFVALPSIVVNPSYRHEGVYADTRVADGNYVYLLETAVAGDGVFKPLNNNVYVEGLAIGNTQAASGSESAMRASGTTTGLLMDACLFVHLNNGRYSIRIDGATTGEIRNSMIYGNSVGGIATTVAGASITLNNVTIKGVTYGVLQFAGTITATNCYAAATTAYSGVSSLTTCASSDTTGSAGLQNIPYSTANFVNVTAGSENLHLVSGSALIGVGTDLSVSFTDDIDGDTRSNWDIGADEYVTASTGFPIPNMRGGFSNMAGGFIN